MSKASVHTYLRTRVRIKFFLAVMASAFALLLLRPVDYPLPAHYFQLSHSLLEYAGIIMLTMICLASWFPLPGRRNCRLTLLSCAFLGVAFLDFTHLLSYDGALSATLPLAKATSLRFSMAAQGFAAVGLLFAAFCPSELRIRETHARLLLIASFAAAVLVSIAIINTQNPASLLYHDAARFSASRAAYALLVMGLYTLCGVVLWRHASANTSAARLCVASACAMFVMSIALFNSYSLSSEFGNIAGHIYKLAGYTLLFSALVVNNIKRPFVELQRLQQRHESILRAIPDMLFETNEEGVILSYHSGTPHADLITTPDEFIGKNYREALPEDAALICDKAISESSAHGSSYGLQYSLSLADGVHRFEISAAKLHDPLRESTYLLIARNVSARYHITRRVEALLHFSDASQGLAEADLLKLGLSMLESLTHSELSAFHILHADAENPKLLAWHSAEHSYFEVFENNIATSDSDSISSACIRTGAATVNNAVEEATSTPAGLPPLKRSISIPIFDNGELGAVLSVANADFTYNKDIVKTVELFGAQLYQAVLVRRTQRHAQQMQHLLSSALDNLPVGVAIFQPGGPTNFSYTNPYFFHAYGIEPGSVSDLDSFWETAFDDEEIRQKTRAKMRADIASADPERMTWQRMPIYRKKRLIRILNIRNIMVPNSGLLVSLIEDVTSTVRSEEDRRITDAAFAMQEDILITDANMRIIRVNAAFEKNSGYSAAEILGKTPRFLRSGRQDAKFYDDMRSSLRETGSWRGELWNRQKDGSVAPYELSISAVENAYGEISHYVATYVSLSAIKSAQKTISRLAYFDTLTGLPNREHFKSMLTELRADHEAARDAISVALMIDIDDFATINETMGHDAGDQLLTKVIRRIQGLLAPTDKLIRYGGDEFVVLIKCLDTDSERVSLKAQLIAQSLLAELETTYTISLAAREEPLSIEQRDYFSTCSIAITFMQGDSWQASDILKQLDIALSSAKENGGNQISFFDPHWQETVSKRALLLNEFRAALQEQQLELYYQAQVDAHSVIVGVEALVRWNHPTRGVLTPAQFLSIAETHQLTKKLGDVVMQLGLQQLHTWQGQTEFSHLKLSINITADQFYDARFEDTLLHDLEQFALSPATLQLEFTESMLLGELEKAQHKIERLKKLGVTFSIDDFGTGYSSLSYLSKLPVDQLKIDKSFVNNIGIIESDAMIVKTVIDMATTLRMQVIAEGVETQEQRSFLLEQGCSMFQGYLFSKPLPIEAFNQFVRAQKTP